MRVESTSLPGVCVLHTAVHPDPRGFFTEIFQAERYGGLGIGPFVQDNHSRSRKGVIRGLHWQRERAQGKLVSVLQGRIWDVVVDLTPGSPTWLQWVGAELGTGTQIWVPAGYAHGFCVLSEEADVLYKCTDRYAPAHARGLRWDDPSVGVMWPVAAPLVSAADGLLPLLDDLDPDDLPRRP